MATETLTESRSSEPAWFKNLIDKYKGGIAHMFLLSRNVGDYVDYSNSLKSYVAKRFGERYDVVVFYNRSRGIEFPTPMHRNNAIKALRLDQKTKDPAQSDNLFAAFRAEGVGGDPSESEAAIPDSSPIEALSTLEALMRAYKEDESDPTLRKPYSVCVMIDYVEHLAPAARGGPLPPEDRYCLIALQEWAKDAEIGRANRIVFLVTEDLSSVHDDLKSARSKIESIPVPRPDAEERLGYIEYLSAPEEDYASESAGFAEGFSPKMFANMTAGLRKIEIEDIYLRSYLSGEPIDMAMVMERKDEIISQEYAEVLELPPLLYGFETFPFPQYIEDWIVPNVVESLRKGETRGCPKGIMWVGPPGCGKSVRVKALAKEAGVNYVQLNLGKTKGKYVGESESRLEKALDAIFSNVPTLVFVDEADQAFPQGRTGGGDSGVSQNILSRIMQVMAEPGWEGKVVWNFATNRPDLIDPALQREGRIDKIIPIMPPDSPEEIAHVMKSVLSRVGYPTSMKDKDLLEVSESLLGRTQAQIEATLKKSYEIARRGDGRIKTEDVRRAVEVLRPSRADVELMTLKALEFCNDLELLPPSLRSVRADETTLEKSITKLEATVDRKFGPSCRGRKEVD